MEADKKWLVKSSDRLRGPFLFTEIVENIFSGEIHLLDEIKGPFERWRPIKDHSLFAAEIEKLKASTYNKREQTVTANLDMSTQTHEITKSLTGSKTHEITHTPVIESSGLENVSIPEASHPRPQQSRSAPYPPRKSKTSGAFLMSFLLLLVGGAGYLVYEFQQTKLIENKVSAYGQLTDQALNFLKLGEYQKALKHFSMAYNIAPSDPNLIIEMAPLSVQFDGQFSQVELMINRLLASHFKKGFSKKAKNIIGLTQSYRGQLQKALLSYEESISADPRFFPAKVNRAFILLKLGELKRAAQFMRQVVGEFPDQAIAHYMYIRSLVAYGLKSKDKGLLQEALSVSTQFAQKFSDFQQEVLFQVALAKMAQGVSTQETADLIRPFLKVDFDLTQLHVHDTQMDFQIFNWTESLPQCKMMMSRLDDYSSQLLEGFCSLKMNQAMQAKNIFEKLLSQKNDDGVLQALYASSLIKLNEVSQAKNTLGFLDKVEEKQPVVETILRGCLRSGDLNCAESIFKGPYSRYISLLYSHWGNSEVHWNTDPKKSRSSIQLGLEMSGNFAPLLKLKSKL